MRTPRLPSSTLDLAQSYIYSSGTPWRRRAALIAAARVEQSWAYSSRFRASETLQFTTVLDPCESNRTTSLRTSFDGEPTGILRQSVRRSFLLANTVTIAASQEHGSCRQFTRNLEGFNDIVGRNKVRPAGQNRPAGRLKKRRWAFLKAPSARPNTSILKIPVLIVMFLQRPQ
jgi:hypothetical protein